MDAARGLVALRLFRRFVGRDVERRREALGRLRRRDAGLADEVSSLLRHFDRVEQVAFLAGPTPALELPPTEAEEGASTSDPRWPPPPPTETGEEHGDLARGARVGRYVVEGVVDRGGMGVVYRAHRVDDYRQATAVKLMGRGLTPTAIRRFHLERQILALMKHPNIVRLLDGGEVDGGRPFLVMDFIEGVSLTQYAREDRPSPRECAALMPPIVAAVAYAHESGVVHRDLKPSNILITQGREPVPMVTDFGLAQLVDEEAAVSLTAAGGLEGTPGYMAPEQILGDAGRRNPAVDVYGLGAVLYFMLTGRPPYHAPTPFETCKLALEQDPEPIARARPGVPRDLATIVEKAMARDPSRRYASALAMGEDLRRFLAGEPIAARPISRLERVGRRLLKHRRLVVAAGLAGLAVVIGAFVGLSRWNLDLSRKNDGLIRLATVYAETMERLAREGGIVDPNFHKVFARFAQAIEEIRQSRGDEAALVDIQYCAGLAQFQLARSYQTQYFRAPAVACFESSVDLLRSLARDHPERGDVRFDLFRSLSCLGEYLNGDDHSRCVALHRESLDVIAALARDEPANMDYLEAEAVQHTNLGRRLMGDRSAEGEDQFRRSIEIGEELRRRPGANPQYLRIIAQAWEAMAVYRHEAGIIDEAATRRSLEPGAELIRVLPKRPEYRDEQAARFRLLSVLRFHLGDLDEAEHLLDEAVAMQESALAQQPRIPQHVERLAGYLLFRADARLARGRIDLARADFTAAEARQDEFIGKRQDDQAAYDRLHMAARCGPLDPAGAERRLAAIPDDPSSLNARLLRVRALLALGRCDEALRLATDDAPPEHRQSAALQFLASTAEARLGRRDEARARLTVADRLVSHVTGDCLFIARLRREAVVACARQEAACGTSGSEGRRDPADGLSRIKTGRLPAPSILR